MNGGNGQASTTATDGLTVEQIHELQVQEGANARAWREEQERRAAEARALLERENMRKIVAKLPHAWTCTELLATDFPPPAFVIPELLPAEGLTLIAGGSKIGKSWLLLAMCHAVATGGFVFGKIPVNPRTVLYLALEDTPRRLKDRLAKLGAEPTERLHVVTEWPRGQAALDYLEAWFSQHSDTGLVAVDTLAKIRRPGEDSNSYDDTYLEAAALKGFADRHELALAAATHTRKAAVGDFLHGVIGSTGQVGGADTIWRLTRARGEGAAVLEVTGRDVADQKLAMRFSAETGTWIHEGDATNAQPTDERQAVVDLLRRASGPLSPAEVAEKLDRDPEATRQLMKRMADKDAIVRVGMGQYTAVEGCHTGHSVTRGETTVTEEEPEEPGRDTVTRVTGTTSPRPGELEIF